MKKYNVIVIFSKDMKRTLMCKRTKNPYKGMLNLVGGKIEKDNAGLNEAYRELKEETNIGNADMIMSRFFCRFLLKYFCRKTYIFILATFSI